MKKITKFLPLCALVLASCADTKTPLDGDRMDMMGKGGELTPDPALAGQKIDLDLSETKQWKEVHTSWTQVGGIPYNAWFPIPAGPLNTVAFITKVGAGKSGRGGIISGPVIESDFVYTVDSQGRLYANDSSTGRQMWTGDINPAGVSSQGLSGGVAYDEGRLFAVSAQGYVVCFDPIHGRLNWRKSVNESVRAAPVIDNGRLFILTISNKLHVLDAETGLPLWDHEGVHEQTRLFGTASPAIFNDKGVALVPYSSGDVHLFKVETGQELWAESLSSSRSQESLHKLSHISAQPVIDIDLGFVISHGGPLVCFDIDTGERIWEKDIGALSTPAVVGHYIFLLTVDGRLACLTRESGNVLWVIQLTHKTDGKAEKVIWYGPLVTADRRLIVAGSHGRVMTLSVDNGAKISSMEIPGRLSHGPVLAKERLYFQTDDGKLVSIK